MPSMSKYVYIDKLDIIADRCNNKYEQSIANLMMLRKAHMLTSILK